MARMKWHFVDVVNRQPGAGPAYPWYFESPSRDGRATADWEWHIHAGRYPESGRGEQKAPTGGTAVRSATFEFTDPRGPRRQVRGEVRYGPGRSMTLLVPSLGMEIRGCPRSPGTWEGSTGPEFERAPVRVRWTAYGDQQLMGWCEERERRYRLTVQLASPMPGMRQ